MNEDIEHLKEELEQISKLTYNHGKVRANFVSMDKSCKTTLFVEKKETALLLLETLCKVCLLEFDTNCVS